ncbi:MULTISPECIES: glycine betaine ABC transporter substrate-binding protein [unclassified Sporosarcina]|uniref:glycine betaine ABC transporter substrate-binding protein n=1 Tax=unclassified Sporosarcina TaxID=2647733 RepID=UPI000C169B05|nr:MULTISPECIES: glycine betaine ABC transporter substrate-binding protein [unclassified Sporosarcina]PIC85668.1 glycine/betaine ABC transporter substrate-binding protein [Sporosarcina sp. P20a]PIC99160.1 glycine/betaine ABC transporter substrate-binding protein [Sporosarcina sp. P29]PID04558.1 glycine/betaine ABC transporter substrate-binding protein [Sporosarcina sp. P30]PID07700.1 glycine/betaine ABC transporter substrate-binding protein [Sporosarcina sp. P31]PID10898.1 glycine/betaine ABC 
MKNKLTLLLVTTLLASLLSGCIFNEKDSLRLGSRNNTESIILSNIMGQLIEDRLGVDIIYKENLGGSSVVWNAMTNDHIDVIPDYTGTIVVTYYQEEPGTAEETLAATKRLVAGDNITALGTFGFNNTYTLALDEEKAEELGLVTFSDFAKVSNDFILGAVFEFIDRPDGLPGFEKEYDIEFKDVKGMDHGMMYRAIGANEVDVINSYTTDGQLAIANLRVLEDDKSYFPPYHALPLVRDETLKEYPELEEILGLLEGQIDEETMQVMNGKVDNDGIMVELVAKEYLVDSGLIEEK